VRVFENLKHLFDVSWILSGRAVRHWLRRSIEPPFEPSPSTVRGVTTVNTTLRLTRRGRVVIVTLLALLLCAAFLMGRSGASAATDTGARPAYTQTTVQPGETLWAVAKRVAPAHDPRALVDEIRSLNHLASGTLTVGQQLLVPRIS